MAKIKKVGFNFFRPVVKTQDDEESLFNFADILEDIRREYLKAKERIDSGLGPEEYKMIYSYNNEPARLADVTIDEDTGYYHVVFDRLDYQVPNRTTLHGESEALDLDDDEYIGIEVNALYDPQHHIFMIQRNRNSLGPSGIEAFLNKVIHTYNHDFTGNFSLAIVSDTTARRRALNQAAYRKLQFKAIGLKADGILEKLRRREGELNVDSVEIIFNSKATKDGKIDDQFTKELLEEYIDDDEIQKLRIRSREEEDSVVEPIDLVDHKLQTFTEFDFRENRQLNSISVFYRMVEKFDTEDGGFKNKVLRM